MEVSMNRRIATLTFAAVFAAGIAVAPSAFAGSSFGVAIGVPGLSVGYSNHGFGYVAAVPPPYFAPTYYAPVVAPVVAFAPPPIVYAPYYRPFVARPYYFRGPVRVGFNGYARHY
jgi:hypothetical protein